MNTDNIQIQISIVDHWAPHDAPPQRVWLNVSRAEFRDAFLPLPRDRDLDFALHERRREQEQRAARQRAADFLARELAPALVEAMGKIDTINGYSPVEWAGIRA